MDPLLSWDGTVVRANIDTRNYRALAVKKAAYRFASKCTIMLEPMQGDTLPLVFHFTAETSEGAALATVRLFFRELLDQELREHLAEEMGPLRTLILAQAFSKTDLIRREP
jgi:His-Xaa-Ser system protein HxsD